MPIANVQDAREVERSLQAVLSTHGAEVASQAIRAQFVEILDFDCTDRLVPLNDADRPYPKSTEWVWPQRFCPEIS